MLSCVSTDEHVCSAVPLLSGPAHNGVPLFHLGCFIRPTEGNGSTSSPHMASHSCSVSLNLSQRGWACGIGWRLLCILEAGNFGGLSQLQGQHIQRKTADNLPPYLHYTGLLFHLLLAVSSLLLSICLFFLRKLAAIYVRMSPLCIAVVIIQYYGCSVEGMSLQQWLLVISQSNRMALWSV